MVQAATAVSMTPEDWITQQLPKWIALTSVNQTLASLPLVRTDKQRLLDLTALRAQLTQRLAELPAGTEFTLKSLVQGIAYHDTDLMAVGRALNKNSLHLGRSVALMARHRVLALNTYRILP